MQISEINIYPIKSLKGISLESALVEERGLQYDRRWMLIDSDGMFMTQREFPRMALVEVSVGDGLYVTAEGYGMLELPFHPATGERRPVPIWQDICEGEVYDSVISDWFSSVLGTACQLVYMPDDTRRSVNPRFDKGHEIVSFADGYPLLVIGEATLADLNSRLDLPLPMNRFRPNFVVAGSDPFAEDNWVTIRVGDGIFRSTKPCARCAVTTVDQTMGEFAGNEPLKTLASYRMAGKVIPHSFEDLGLNATAVLFGQNLIAESPGKSVCVGDTVEVVA